MDQVSCPRFRPVQYSRVLLRQEILARERQGTGVLDGQDKEREHRAERQSKRLQRSFQTPLLIRNSLLIMIRKRFHDAPLETMDNLGASRLRKIQRVEGEFPTFFYTFPKSKDKLIAIQKKLHEYFKAKGIQAQLIDEPHIVLSRIVKLGYTQIDNFIKTFKDHHLPIMRKLPLVIRECHFNMIVTGEGQQSAPVEPEPLVKQPSKQEKSTESSASQPPAPPPVPAPPLPQDKPKQEIYVGLSAGAHFASMIESIDMLMGKFKLPKYYTHPPVVHVSLLRLQCDKERVKSILQDLKKQKRWSESILTEVEKLQLRIDQRVHTYDLK